MPGWFRPWRRRAVALLAVLGMLSSVLIAGSAPASASSSQLDQPMVVINPGGGVLEDGSDGLKLVMNSSTGWVGQDQTYYRNTYQYCCSASAPMLNIGGILYGQAGPAFRSPTWDTLEIVELTGSATSSEGTDLGSGSATLRYTVTHNELVFSMDRIVTYVHPNNTAIERYEISIPEGNTEVVKFYLGGDTAPGSSDSGVGFEVTEPVRTIYSVNPYSDIQLGYGEIPGEAPFDGARVASFYPPYETVQMGGDIGFEIDTSGHDAGILMQWTIGTEPGVHTRAMQRVVGERGAAITAAWGTTEVDAGEPTTLDLTVLNTGSTDADEIGFTFDLPEGVAVASDAATNSCGGTATAAAGASAVSLETGSVVGGDSCLISVPVAAADAGEYTFTASSVSTVTGMSNFVGTATLTVAETVPVCDRAIVGPYAGRAAAEGSIARFYMSVFTRQPDEVGFDYWTAQHEAGVTVEQIAWQFLDSDEFDLVSGDDTDAEFVEVMYGNVLCRASDAPGKAYWEEQLADGMARKAFLLELSESVEFRGLTGTA